MEVETKQHRIADGWAESFSFIICCNIKALTELRS